MPPVLRRHAALLAALLCACSIERSESGRPPGPPTPADSLARLEEDSAAAVQVERALNSLFGRLAAKDARGIRRSFWPGAVVTLRRSPTGPRAAAAAVLSLDEFVRAVTGTGPDTLPAMQVVSADVRSYGTMASAWVVFSTGRDGATHGMALAQLTRGNGEWRLSGLSLSPELTGRPLGR